MHGLTKKMVFLSHLEIEMMINRKIYVLKGQHNLAQGNALGMEIGERIVRAMTFIKEKFIFRTKKMIAISRQMIPFYSVRKKFFAINIMFSRTVFVVPPFTQGCVSDRSSRNFTLGYYILALQAGKTLANDFWKTSWTKTSK